ncbi:hypothetical protein RKE30_36310 [Streptomyces sp. Li-HN-5-11]|uniref:hypothetical protein n=1 Tax=Streptomyces sp. Li-HN-5-11 TaxID=3075432 RepID=UPI0028AA10A8|nr:hypothetical protein [Streptomyces sp. Li-HN-5-11]WNM35440.1 hypothetical protein RKE30_36310 [Streptomyces sp. Li-HN-5-11]
MIHLSFSLPEPTSPWRRTWDGAKQGDPAGIAEIDLRYKYFGVNVEMVMGDVEIISKGRFVTLVDLALSLRAVVERIYHGEDAAFGFTESDEVIRFRQAGERILVTSSKNPGEASVTREELLEKLSEFLQSAHSRLVEEIPELGENPVVRGIASGSEL